jgi:hypothetical protein
MAEMRHRQPSPAPGLAFSEIMLPDEKDVSTGTYTIGIKSGVLVGKDKIVAAVINAPRFQIEVSIDPQTRIVRAAVGPANAPVTKREIELPDNLDRKAAHTLEIRFKNWNVTDILIGNRKLF